MPTGTEQQCAYLEPHPAIEADAVPFERWLRKGESKLKRGCRPQEALRLLPFTFKISMRRKESMIRITTAQPDSLLHAHDALGAGGTTISPSRNSTRTASCAERIFDSARIWIWSLVLVTVAKPCSCALVAVPPPDASAPAIHPSSAECCPHVSRAAPVREPP